MKIYQTHDKGTFTCDYVMSAELLSWEENDWSRNGVQEGQEMWQDLWMQGAGYQEQHGEQSQRAYHPSEY